MPYKSPLCTVLRLQQYVKGVSSPLVVLQNFPSVDSQAHAFIAARLQWQSWLETLEETLQACSTHSSLAETIQFVAISDLTYDISTIPFQMLPSSKAPFVLYDSWNLVTKAAESMAKSAAFRKPSEHQRWFWTSSVLATDDSFHSSLQFKSRNTMKNVAIVCHCYGWSI